MYLAFNNNTTLQAESLDEKKEPSELVASKPFVKETKLKSNEKAVSPPEERVELLELESNVAIKYTTDQGTKIRSDAIRNMTPQSLDSMFNEFANSSQMTDEISSHKAQYEDAFVSAIGEQQSFALNRLECGVAVCIATIELNGSETARDIAKRIRKAEGFDSRAISAIPNRENENIGELGFIFSRGAGNASFIIPSDASNISFKKKTDG